MIAMDRAASLAKSYTRQSAFSYSCHACSRCCHAKIIHVNPYEVARLAENRGVSTTECLARFTDAGGTALRQSDTGACVFLTAQGCSVHPDRPLVCRIYPLGRRVTAEGDETFHELTPHPQTAGEYGVAGTVQDYLASQGAEPFLDAVDRYVELVARLSVTLRSEMGRDPVLKQRVQETVGESVAGTSIPAAQWMDMDRVVEDYCARHGIEIPTAVSAKMHIHIEALEEFMRTSR